MAPSATEEAIVEQISKPPAGVVLPPKDIRAIVEKTAGYVARNGAVFEERIRAKEQNNAKFSFLNPADAYNAFYVWRLSEIREGRGTTVSAGRVGEEGGPVKEAKSAGPAQPPEFQFSARMPNISAQDLEVVKLTALFVAKNGRSWMTQLSQKEAGNYQFDFLRPQHSLYQFFSRLVDQYTALLSGSTIDGGRPEKERIRQLQRNVKDKFHVMVKAKQRAEWVRYQEQQKAKKEEEAEAEKIAYAQIDWHDFVLVETVLFNEADEHTELPPPTSLNDLQSASLEQKAMMSLAPPSHRIEEAMPGDDDYSQHTPQPPQMPTSSPAPPPQSYGPPQIDYAMGGYNQSVGDEEESRAIRERQEAQQKAQQAQAAARAGPAQFKIRNDYVPRAQARSQRGATVLCPNCKEQIPADEFEHHMRIELLDPRWRDQRDLSKQRDAFTNLTSNDVANNLKRLASQRADVFDSATKEYITEEEAARRKRAATAYDGQFQPVNQGMDVAEQIKQIHQKYKQ